MALPKFSRIGKYYLKNLEKILVLNSTIAMGMYIKTSLGYICMGGSIIMFAIEIVVNSSILFLTLAIINTNKIKGIKTG